MNDVIQHYLRTYAKGRIDDFTEPRSLFMPFTPETDEEKHEHQFNELKQTQIDFHEYVSVLINAIDENIKLLNKPFKISIIHNKQIQQIKSDLSFMKKSILRNEQHVNFDTNILLEMLPTGNKNNYTLSKEEIKSLKDDNILQEYELILFGGEPGDIYSFPQEPLFSLIDSFISLCRITMRLCLIQQQIQDLYFEGDFDPEKKKEILYVKDFINDKMSDIKEELYTYNMKLEAISDAQIQFFSKQEHTKWSIKQEIKKTKKQTLKKMEQTNKTLTEQKKFKANKQKDLAKWIRSGMAIYCWNNKRTVKERIRDGLKLPKEPTIIRMFNHWNQYLHATSEKKKEMTEFEPYHKYSEILYASEENVNEWGKQIFAPIYIKKWMARKKEKEEKRRRKNGKKRPDALDRLNVGGDDGENIMDDLVAQKNDVDQAFYFDDEPQPKKRRFKSL